MFLLIDWFAVVWVGNVNVYGFHIFLRVIYDNFSKLIRNF